MTSALIADAITSAALMLAVVIALAAGLVSTVLLLGFNVMRVELEDIGTAEMPPAPEHVGCRCIMPKDPKS